MKIFGLILAAGYSSRMGDFKPLLLFEEKSFIINIIEKLDSCCERIFIVVGHSKNTLITHVKKSIKTSIKSRIMYIENKNFSDGMLSSIQAGLKAIKKNISQDDYVMLHLVDQPHIPVNVYAHLADEAKNRKHDIIIPSYNMNAGHPIVFNRKILEQVLLAAATSNLKEIIQKNKDRIQYLEVDDEQVLQDINTQEDKEEFLS